MEKEFIPYGLSVKLKTLGFDEPCFLAFDNCSTPMRCSDLRTNEQKFNGVNYNSSTYTSQPTFSQAFRWFREKQAIEGFIHKAIEGTYYFVIKRLGNNESNMYEFITNAPKNVDTFEEAELACLEKLIEIVEQKNEE